MEYLQLILCRDVFHCPPDQLPDYATCMKAFAMIEAEHMAKERLANRRRR